MTDVTHITITPATMRAELDALPDGYDWIVEDCSDWDRILADTHAAYAPTIEDMRAEIAGERSASDVTFLMVDGEPWTYTDLRSEARRPA